MCSLWCSRVTLCLRCVSDVDECSLGRSHCSGDATCYNTPGSYKCKCRDGFRGMGHDCKRKKPADKIAPTPAQHRAQSGSGGLTFLFAFSTLAWERVGKRKRGRNSLSSRRAGIPFFVGAVSPNPSLCCPVTWAFSQRLTSAQVNQGNRWVKRETRQVPAALPTDTEFINLRSCFLNFFFSTAIQKAGGHTFSTVI